jgi:flagellar hook protein FlgE
MMRALFAGMSGLRNHQTKMDVIGNNIANINTTAFKASRVTFKEAFVQLLQGASRPPGNTGGINPIQIGTGMNVGSIDQLFTQGSLESTGQPLDLAIQGDATFVLSDGLKKVYTRAGNFQLDAQGHLISPSSGFVVQGINADAQGNFSTAAAIGDVQLRLGDKAPAQATSVVNLSGNLDSSAVVGATHQMGITVYDNTGTPQNLQLLFTKTSATTWDWAPSCATATITPAGTGTVTFSSNTGTLSSFTYPGGAGTLTLTPTAGGAPFNTLISPGTINGFDGLASFANPSNAIIASQNGYQAGSLQTISVDNKGVISGYFTNGVTRSLAQLSLAQFTNPSGLLRSGDNTYLESANSGGAVVGFAGGTISSTITPGALEGSNVDISQEFTEMIIAQRGFQANAKVITTADEMLNDLVHLRG